MRRFIIALLPLLLSGCLVVPIPYIPEAEVRPLPTEVEDADGVLLTLGPRELLEEIREGLADHDERVEIVDALSFRDAVFPAGNWTLTALEDPERRDRIAATGADFLVAIGRFRSDWGDKSSVPLPFVGYLDLYSWAALAAIVVDLEDDGVTGRWEVRSDARHRGAYYFVGFIGSPDTSRSVREGMVSELARTLGEARPTGDVSVVVMAAERPYSDECPLRDPTERDDDGEVVEE